MALLVARKACDAQRVNIDGLGLSQRDFFGQQATDGGGLLDAVTGEAGDVEPVFDAGETTEDGVVIGRDFVVAPPAGVAIQSRLRPPGETFEAGADGWRRRDWIATPAGGATTKSRPITTPSSVVSPASKTGSTSPASPVTASNRPPPSVACWPKKSRWERPNPSILTLCASHAFRATSRAMNAILFEASGQLPLN